MSINEHRYQSKLQQLAIDFLSLGIDSLGETVTGDDDDARRMNQSSPSLVLSPFVILTIQSHVMKDG